MTNKVICKTCGELLTNITTGQDLESFEILGSVTNVTSGVAHWISGAYECTVDQGEAMGRGEKCTDPNHKHVTLKE